MSHRIRPASNFRYISPSTATLRIFSASPSAERTFCGNCGSFLTWRPTRADADYLCFAVGTVDPLYLFGEGADGIVGENQTVPENGYGLALAYCGGIHEYCANEIPGVTDKIPLLGFERGKRCPGDASEEAG
jgi:hypothetical protein